MATDTSADSELLTSSHVTFETIIAESAVRSTNEISCLFSIEIGLAPSKEDGGRRRISWETTGRSSG
ncbi:MAG: hypothetical protein ACKER6_00705 [Candidatus Hodgkinia cicadicola]